MLVYHGKTGPEALNCEDYYIQEEWNGWEDSIHLSLPVDHPQRLDLVERLRLTDRESGQIYAVTIIDEGTRTTDITAALDLAELEADMLLGYTNGSDTALSTIEGVLPQGWIADDHTGGLTIRRTVTLEGGGTPLDVIEQCVEKFSGLAIRFDNAARVVHLWYPPNLTVFGAYYTDELNLTERPQFRGKASDFYTRLYPVGKDGLTISDVNNGVPYVECHDWSDEIISRYWKDERYTDAQSLLEDAQTAVNNAGIPERSYVCSIADLAKVDPDRYGHLTASLYQIVTLIDRSRRSRVRHHVAQYRCWPHHPEKNTITLSTVPGKLSGKLGSVYAAVTDTAGKTDFAQRQAAKIAVLTSALSNASGLYPTQVTQSDGSTIYYLHDRPTLAASKTIIKVTAEALGISVDGGATYTTGLTVDGDTIVRILNAVGVDANWIKAGVIQSANSDAFYFDLDTGEFRLKLDVGGRNYLLGTSDAKTVPGNGNANAKTVTYDLAAGSTFDLFRGKTVTFSCTVDFDEEQNDGSMPTAMAVVASGSSGSLELGRYDFLLDILPGQRFSATITVPDNTPDQASQLVLRFYYITGTVRVRQPKLELGSIATDWTPAGEDVEAELSLKVGKDDNDQIVSMLNASADVIKLLANRLIIQSSGFNLDENGYVTATKGTIGGLTLTDKTLTATCRYDYPTFTSADVTKVQNYAVGLGTLTDAELVKYDVNMDGKVSSVDAMAMQKMMNGMEPSYSIYKLTIDATDPAACIRVAVTEGYHAGWETKIGIGALSTRDMVVTNSLKADNVMELKGYSVSDFVISQDTDGIWTWRKWYSGVAECWGKRNLGTVPITGTWGSFYESSGFSEYFPSGLFSAAPSYLDIQFLGGDPVGGGSAMIERGASSTEYLSKDCIGKYWLYRPTQHTGIPDCTVGFYAIGKWR